MNWLGDYPEDFATVAVYFTTHDANGAPVAPLSAFETADVIIYKNGDAAQKTTTNGLTMTSPFDSIVGLHRLLIDTSNDTGDSGFWTTGGGSVYTVVLSPDTETVNGQTVVKVIGTFGICLTVSTVVEGTKTILQMLRGFAAAMLGKASGLAGTTAVYRDTGDTKDRITATVDASGNRSAVTLDLTP